MKRIGAENDELPQVQRIQRLGDLAAKERDAQKRSELLREMRQLSVAMADAAKLANPVSLGVDQLLTHSSSKWEACRKGDLPLLTPDLFAL
ncbi:MAG: hypothetical protein ACOYXY_07025 [Thermodesulfobacteriota bacterium]